MSLIVTAYDLTGGTTLSTEVVAPSTWRVTATVTGGLPRQRVKCILEVEDEQGNWSPLKDDVNRVISLMVVGNDTVSTNALLANAANGRVRVAPKADAEGTINVDSINS